MGLDYEEISVVPACCAVSSTSSNHLWPTGSGPGQRAYFRKGPELLTLTPPTTCSFLSSTTQVAPLDLSNIPVSTHMYRRSRAHPVEWLVMTSRSTCRAWETPSRRVLLQNLTHRMAEIRCLVRLPSQSTQSFWLNGHTRLALVASVDREPSRKKIFCDNAFAIHFLLRAVRSLQPWARWCKS